jgi:hypothetical protein
MAVQLGSVGTPRGAFGLASRQQRADRGPPGRVEVRWPAAEVFARTHEQFGQQVAGAKEFILV